MVNIEDSILSRVGHEQTWSFCEGVEGLLSDMKAAHAVGASDSMLYILNSISIRLSHIKEDIQLIEDVKYIKEMKGYDASDY